MKNLFSILFILTSIIYLLSNCSVTNSNLNSERILTLNDVNDFVFQLQNIKLSAICKTKYDMVVIDYSTNSYESGKWSHKQINTLKSSKGGKIVLAYISIGEAETYRSYWKSNWHTGNPIWLGNENPDWKNNYKVKYWNPDWQKIIFNYLDKIIAQGFDGIYMDIVDGYWYWANLAASNGENEQLKNTRQSANLMIEFIINISNYCRVVKGKPDFILCQQNASGIIFDASPSGVSKLWNVIDAIGAEDTFYFGDKDEDNQYNAQTYVINNLDTFVKHGKKVFAIDYLSSNNKTDINRFYTLCREHGYVPFVTRRALDILRINKDFKPD